MQAVTHPRLHALYTHTILRARIDDPEISQLVRVGFVACKHVDGVMFDFTLTLAGKRHATSIFRRND